MREQVIRASCYLLLLAIFLLSSPPDGMAKTISRLTPVEFNKIVMSWETDFTAMLSKADRENEREIVFTVPKDKKKANPVSNVVTTQNT